MNFNPKISVIMSVSKNYSNFLNLSIESILQQTFKEFEFIIIDDGSIDDTSEILHTYQKKDNRISVYKQNNQGLASSLNTAISKSKTNFIARQDYDDISEISRLEKQFNWFNLNKDFVICGTFAHNIDKHNNKIGLTKNVLTYEKHKKYLEYKNTILHPSVMFKKDAIINVGGYNIKYICSQDYELWTRVIKKYKIANIPEFLINLRLHDKTTSTILAKNQRICSFLIGLKYKFESFADLDNYINKHNFMTFLKNYSNKDKLGMSYFHARKYVYLYEVESFFRIFKLHLFSIFLVLKIYYYRPTYLIRRLFKLK